MLINRVETAIFASAAYLAACIGVRIGLCTVIIPDDRDTVEYVLSVAMTLWRGR